MNNTTNNTTTSVFDIKNSKNIINCKINDNDIDNNSEY